VHLFLLVPNNSGSSILHDLIATSPDVAILPAEGQFCDNFVGPLAHQYGIAHFFTKKEDIFRNKKNYEWEVIKRQWDFHWARSNPNATIFLQKSPPDIVRANMLTEEFTDTKFIIMIRNPYAMVESILRANPAASLLDAATHAIRCLEIQLENSEKYLNDLVFKYEDLTDNTIEVVRQIEEFLNISRIDSSRIFNTKGYSSKILNMNEFQIKKLSDKQLAVINSVFSKNISVLTECGYELIESENFNFKFISSINVENIKNKLASLTDDAWKEFTFRQETYDVHAKTLTIPLIFSKDFESENVNYQKYFEYFGDDLLVLTKIFEEKLGFGYITRAILVNLKANSIIPEHIDSGESLDACHRMHIPLVTNTKCDFRVGSEILNMKTGEIWEIDNTNKIHSVQNLSDEDRVHLIIDWITIID
jgi:hypothetical protein